MEGLDTQARAAGGTMTPSGTVRTVSKFEHDLLVILRHLFGRAAPQQAHALLGAKQPAPKCLSRDCVELVKDTLAKGVVLHLVRAGGWRNDSFLADGVPTGGRVWNRIPLPNRKPTFSRNVLDFLIWLTAERPDASNDQWLNASGSTPADEWFFAVAYDRLREEPDWQAGLRIRSAFANNPYCWLLSPGDFVGAGEPRPPEFVPLFSGARAAILECLQPELARRWIASERQKGTLADWNEMRRIAGAESAMLVRYLAAAEAAERPDLARWVLHTLAAVLAAPAPDAADWIGGLETNAPPRLADRLAVQRDALAFPRQMVTLDRWDRAARAVGYFDEGYAASQLWKEEYEAANGLQLFVKVKRVLEQLDPLRN
jgi:FtsH ternary system domain X6